MLTATLFSVLVLVVSAILPVWVVWRLVRRAPVYVRWWLAGLVLLPIPMVMLYRTHPVLWQVLDWCGYLSLFAVPGYWLWTKIAPHLRGVR